MLFLGIMAGTITGLIPGVHANTIAFIALYSPIDKNLGFAIFIVAMSITHSFVDAIPNILLGAPSSESFLTALPRHELLLKGRGLEAIQFTIMGGVITGIFSVLLAPFVYSLAITHDNELPIIIPAILFATISLLVLTEKNKKAALIVILLSGVLGSITLGSGIQNPIMPLIIGFFAVPSLLETITTNTKIPEQKQVRGKKIKLSTGFFGSVLAGFTSIFPAIGPSEAATAAKKLLGKTSKAQYLMLVGGINTGNLVLSIVALEAIGKTRTGMAVALKDFLVPDQQTLIILLAAAVAAIGFAAIVTEHVAMIAVSKIQKINYSKASIIVLTFLVFLVFYSSGFNGLLAGTSAAGISLYTVHSKIRRSTLMGFLMLPTMLYYTANWI